MSRATKAPASQSVRPALPVLQQDQRALLTRTANPRYDDDRRLRPGFETLRGVIHWYQRATVRTFGKLSETWAPEDLLESNDLAACLVVGPERHQLHSTPPSLTIARKVRRVLEADVVHPACNAAFNELRGAAGEYIERDDRYTLDDELRPEGQEHLAMRPTFEYADYMQDRALRQLWGGFENRDALLDWLHGLNEASNGAIPPDLASLTDRDDVLVACLLDEYHDSDIASATREDFAIKALLPAFTEGIGQMSAGELASVKQTPTEPSPV